MPTSALTTSRLTFTLTLAVPALIAIALPALLGLPCVLRGECGPLAFYATQSPTQWIALCGGAALITLGIYWITVIFDSIGNR